MTKNETTAPLTGIRVLNYGGLWAGRVAAVLLADQGAEVIEIQRPGREQRSEDALLGRGKTIVTLDLTKRSDSERAQALAAGADIVFDNLGPGRARRFGLDEARVREVNPAVVYVSTPGFASGSSMADTPAWEGTVAASTGVYTGIHGTGPVLGGTPIFTAVPMASAYGGVHAAVAATIGLLQRINTGSGQSFEVPLADAVLSAMALLAMEVEGQPQRYDLPLIDRAMTEVAFPIFRSLQPHLSDAQRAKLVSYLSQSFRPQFANYRCADGRMIFINAVEHILHSTACLQVLGLLNGLVAEGMVVASPYQEGGEGNNICSSTGMSLKWVARMRAVMEAKLLEKPAAEWEQLFRSAGVPASVVRTTDEWLAWPPAREAGIVCQIEDADLGVITQAGRFLTIEGKACSSPPLKSRQHVVATQWHGPRTEFPQAAAPSATSGKPLAGMRVLDLSNVIAGPAAARVFAELGAEVIRIDPPAPFAGPRMTMWFGIDVNQGKQALILDLKSPKGRELLGQLVQGADAIIHNFPDRSAESLGISDAQLKALNPNIVSCQISAWGGPTGGPLKNDPAFDPVLQAATGITARYGSPGAPVLHGLASCVDYITGFTAALGVAQALVACKLGRGAAHVRTSLSMGAQLVQFPFVVARNGLPGEPEPSGQTAVGYGTHYRQYQLRDGAAFLACRSSDVTAIAEQLGAKAATAADIAGALSGLTVNDAASRLKSIAGASLVPIRRLDDLRAESTLADVEPFDSSRMSLAMVRSRHPSGHRITLPLPTWYRSPSFSIQALSGAPAPGSHSRRILAGIGVNDDAFNELIEKGVVAERWEVLKHYLPR